MALKGKGGGKGDEEDEDLFLPLRDVFMRLKQGPMNFATYQTGDKDKPVVLAAHKRKNPEALGKLAKKQAGTPKGCYGSLTLEEGGLLTFLCATEDAPSTIGKRIRVMLKNEGFAKFKVRILLPGGGELGETEDDEEGGDGAAAGDGAPPEIEADAAAGDPMEQLRIQVQAEFDALTKRIDAVSTEIPPGVMRKVEGLCTMFAAEIGRDPRKGQGIVQLLRKTLESAGIGAAGDDAASSGPASRASALAELEKGIDALLAAYG